MKRISLFLVAITLALTTFATLLPSKKADAATTGWETHDGITANVYTDRTGNYPVSDTYIGVTGEKTSTGGTVYYSVHLDQKVGSSWIERDVQEGYFAYQTPMKKFYIDNYVNKGSSGTFRIRFKIWKDPSYTVWMGDWITPSFVVYN